MTFPTYLTAGTCLPALILFAAVSATSAGPGGEMPSPSAPAAGQSLTSLMEALVSDRSRETAAAGLKIPSFHPQRVLVRFKPDASPSGQQSAHRAALSRGVLRSYRCVRGLQLVEVPSGQLGAALEAYRADPNVLYAEPNIELQLLDPAIPNDPHFPLLWGLHNTGQIVEGDPGTSGADIRAVKAWEVWDGDETFRIAVIDTGVDYTHPDLAGNIWTNPDESPGDADLNGCPGVCGVDDDGDGLIDEDSAGRQPGEPGYSNDLANDDDENGYVDDIHGYDFADDDGDPMDDAHFHGTHVAGTIAAVGNNNLGVVGVNHSCSIVALKFLCSCGAIYIDSAIAAMQYVIDNRIRVSNNSWGWSYVVDDPEYFSQALYDAIAASQAVGHIFVAAAGNGDPFFHSPINNDVIPHYPSSYDLPNVIAVAATNNDDGIAWFSNYGPTTVDVGAPGLAVYSTLPFATTDAYYGYASGTSMATPHVVGTLGLVMSRFPDLSWQDVRSRFLWTTRPVDSLAGITVAGGVADAGAAVWDCNGNDIPDEDDIDGGNSPDCNGNLLPDECEDDCNGNGIADECDITDGTSEDCAGDGVPDECEPDCNGNSVADRCDIADCQDQPWCDDCNSNGAPDECDPGWDLDCNGNGDFDLCEIAGGRGYDCNANTVPDDCDVASGTSLDCTGNGRPDECEYDCNGNGVADSCDIVESPRLDENGDRLIDACAFGFTLVPRFGEFSVDGDHVLVEPGGRVGFEIHLSGWDGDMDGEPRLLAYQLELDEPGPTAGASGSVGFARLPCEGDFDCWGASQCQAGGVCDPRAAFYIDGRHPDYVFSGLGSWFGASRDDRTGGWLLMSLLLFASDGVRDLGQARYGATLILDVSEDAVGTFRVWFRVEDAQFSLWVDTDMNIMEVPGAHPVLITVPDDCNKNGILDHRDVANGTSQDRNANGRPDECELSDRVIYVDDDAPADPGPGDPAVSDPGEDGSHAHPYDAIQEAIDVAAYGETIIVRDGTYRGTGNRSLNFGGRLITLRSESGPQRCIIDCENADRGMLFVNGETAEAVVEGLTIANGHADRGAAIYLRRSSPTVTNCTFNENSAEFGAGVYVSDCSPTISGCTFRGNHADTNGGGMTCNASLRKPVLSDCVFNGNSAGLNGGGISSHFGKPVLNNCVFIRNSSQTGGAVSLVGDRPTLTNCTFLSNWATVKGGAIHNSCARQWKVANCTFVANSAPNGRAISCDCTALAPHWVPMVNCILWDGGEEIRSTDHFPIEIRYSNVYGGWPGDGNIAVDPGFVDADGSDELLGSEDDDIRLLPGSPCIDAGDNAGVPYDAPDLDGDDDTIEPIPLDLDFRPRFVDDLAAPDCWQAPGTCGEPPVVDMGAYEASRPGDCDGNGYVDLFDQEVFRSCVTGPGGEATPACRMVDLDGDRDVDLADYGAFQRWFTGSI